MNFIQQFLDFYLFMCDYDKYFYLFINFYIIFDLDQCTMVGIIYSLG